MSDLTTFVNSLSRPRLLLRAARHGLADYNRSRVLKRLMRTQNLPSPTGAVTSLLRVEASLENARRDGDAAYSVTRHVEVMIALLAETRLLAGPKAVG